MGASLTTALSLAAILVVGMALALSQFCFVRTLLGARSGNLSRPIWLHMGFNAITAAGLLLN
jgi:hypothetical protein